ncbi:hypothetical protein TVAG_311230 [Trichomonas vaginalis G3]|uniref:Uncharacterized protein n=1 Tax=Trichomonas vaginalis (strain ATCC PRA-98 / G3) TaxID=412133 RepID=A2FUQ5_TRIV3|nr:hypothetical protein TVAGG3_0544580 [Trichomonas vaginalis G3]EAX91372.1 hypothetical protein TVAG_311230 [Trichomonas vaginalis G3]KAI5520082.1 hypothetical protein TVAGG3_0544580 [Trichomonas vaginalis G3]|eukprot:XP_001304302.1 hypothetical protein [Trichomonas vaginalis G3]
MISTIPYIQLVNEGVSGFVDIQASDSMGMLNFIPLEIIPENKRIIFSQFLFTHKIPKVLYDLLTDQAKIIIIEFKNFSILEPKIDSCEFVFSNEEGKSYTLKFNNPFYMETFFTAISFYHCVELRNETQYEIGPQFKPIRIQPRSSLRNSLTSCVHDLYAHQSLLEFLHFPMDPKKKESNLLPFKEECILKLIEEPTDIETLDLISKSYVPIEYCSIMLLLLLLDGPLYEGEKNTLNSETSPKRAHRFSFKGSQTSKLLEQIDITKPLIIESPYPKIYAIDQVSIGGSTSIANDYAALKHQWSTITSTQFNHMNSLRISFKLLENALTTYYQKGHPLIQSVFNILASLFIMKDEFETFNSELYSIAIDCAELFHAINQTLDLGFCSCEHIIFWIFFALITKTGIVDMLEDKSTETVLKTTLHILITYHPLLHTLIDKAGLQNFRFPVTVITSLYTKVLPPEKLYPIWIAALAFGDPMEFFQHLMATALIMLYPNIVDAPNFIETTEKELKKFFDESPSDFLISNTLKLLEAMRRN